MSIVQTNMKRTKFSIVKRFCILASVVAIFSCFYANFSMAQTEQAAKNPATKRVSIIQVIKHPALDDARQGIVDALKEQDPLINIDFQSAQGNASLAAQIAQKYVGDKPNVMVGIGTSVSQALVAADQHHSIPIVFSSVTDPLAAKLVNDLQKPEGVVTGVSNFIEPMIQFDFFKKILPNLNKIGIIYSPGEPNSVALNDKMLKFAKVHGIQLVFAPANTTADVPQATQSLIGRVQAIFINNDNIALSAFSSIVKIGTQNAIPVFCSDTDMVKQGALAAIGPNQYEIGKQTGKIILKILAGEKPTQIPVEFPQKTEMWINIVYAKKLKIEIPKEVLSNASLVTDDTNIVKNIPTSEFLLAEDDSGEDDDEEGCQCSGDDHGFEEALGEIEQ